MGLDRQHYISIAIFTVLFFVMYFGCNTKPEKNISTTEKSEVAKEISSEMRSWLDEADNKLSEQQLAEVVSLRADLDKADNKSKKEEANKALASFWYSVGNPLISGHYAENIALSQGTEGAYSIMGTTFAIAAKSNQEESIRQFAITKSRGAYNKALELNPDNVDHQINLALSYVDVMDRDNPMKGILMLRQLSEDYPENPLVLFQLGRLSLGTNQLEKAVNRLTKVVEIDPDYKEAYCLLAETYNKMGNQREAESAQKKCEINK